MINCSCTQPIVISVAAQSTHLKFDISSVTHIVCLSGDGTSHATGVLGITRATQMMGTCGITATMTISMKLIKAVPLAVSLLTLLMPKSVDEEFELAAKFVSSQEHRLLIVRHGNRRWLYAITPYCACCCAGHQPLLKLHCTRFYTVTGSGVKVLPVVLPGTLPGIVPASTMVRVL